MSEILNLKDLKVYYPIRSGFFNRVTDNVLAVDGVDLTIHEGETVGLVGESGSGKSTIGKTIVGLEQMTSGQLIYKGQDVSKKKIRNQLKYNKDVQMIFQDAFSSLNPRKTIYDIIAEPIRNFEKIDANTENKRIHELLDIVGLPKQALEQYPFQFSGGQQQRIGIARAVATNPKLIVADEPVSALDLSVQAQVLNFMKLIQKDLGIAFLFISHDLGVVRHMTIKMKIKLVVVGKLKEKYLKDGIAEYVKRMGTMLPLEIIELADEKIPDNASEKEAEALKKREGEKILSRIQAGDQLAILAIQGKLMSSEEVADFVKKAEVYGTGNLVFVIGGSLGLSKEVYQRSDLQISFGRMTLPHQLMRLVLVEQIYRAQMINRGSAYHK
ncbi:23S rRNA (pseudouridine(1915)-N(3))-methyltransferase RlmH [Lactococcus lactis]